MGHSLFKVTKVKLSPKSIQLYSIPSNFSGGTSLLIYKKTSVFKLRWTFPRDANYLYFVYASWLLNIHILSFRNIIILSMYNFSHCWMTQQHFLNWPVVIFAIKKNYRYDVDNISLKLSFYLPSWAINLSRVISYSLERECTVINNALKFVSFWVFLKESRVRN